MNLQQDPGAELGLVTLAGLAEQTLVRQRSGTYSILVRSQAGQAGVPISGSTATWPQFTTAPGTKYLLWFWVNGDLATDPFFPMTFEIDYGDGNWVTHAVIVSTSGWQIVLQIMFEAVGSYAQLRFSSPSPGPLDVTNNRWYIDDIVVEELTMPTTQPQICNLALSKIGQNAYIDSINDASTEAAECKLHYDQVLDECLRQVDWGFARTRAALNLQTGDPPKPWHYQYVYPSDVVQARRIDTGLREGEDLRHIQYRTELVGGLRLLYTNQEDACLVYTARVTDPNLYPSNFVDYLSWKLAAAIVMPLTGNRALRNDTETLANLALQRAITADFDNEQEPPEQEAGYIAAR